MHRTLALNIGRPKLGVRFQPGRPDAMASSINVPAALPTADRTAMFIV
jgi:hypothetical protein